MPHIIHTDDVNADMPGIMTAEPDIIVMTRSHEAMSSQSEDRDVDDDDAPLIPNNPEDELGSLPGGDSIRRLPKHKKWQQKYGLVEAVVISYYLAIVTSMPIMEQYLYARFSGFECHSQLNDTSIINDSTMCVQTNSSETETLAQRKTSAWSLATMACAALPAAFSTLLIGPYSDRKGRKFAIVLPACGSLVRLLVTLCVIYWTLPLPILIFGYLAEGMTGFFGVSITAIHSYLADITEPGRERGLRLAVFESSLAIVVGGAQVGTGYFIREACYFYPMLTVAGLLIFCIIATLTLIPETITPDPSARLFDKQNFKRTFLVYKKKGMGQRRFILLAGVSINVLCEPAFIGKRAVEMLYEMKSPLCWDSVKIGVFTAAGIGVQMIFIIISIKPLQRFCSNLTIVMLGALSGTASAIFESFAVTDLMMFMVPVFGVLTAISGPFIKTTMSGCTEQAEQGALFAGLAFMTLLMSGVTQVSLNAVYMATVTSMPGCVFLIVAVCSFTAFLLTVLLKRRTNHSNQETDKVS